MRKLDNSKNGERTRSRCVLRSSRTTADDLESMGEPISKHRVMDIILSGMTNEYELIQFQAMKDSEFSLDDLKFTMRNIYVNGLHNSGRPGRGSATSADAARRDKSGLKCHSCGKTGHFQRECTTNTKRSPTHRMPTRSSLRRKEQHPRPSGARFTTQRLTTTPKAQAAGKSSQDSPAQQTRGKVHNANAATQEKQARRLLFPRMT